MSSQYIADGYRRGKKLNKFGRNAAVGTTLVPICYSGFYRTPTALTSLEIVSSSASDTSNGVGARTVIILGIGTDYKEVSEIVTMNGTTPVQLAKQYYRVYRAYVVGCGRYATQSLGSHVGNITIRETGGGDTWTVIDDVATFPRGQTQVGAFTVPAGSELYIDDLKINVDTTKVANIALYQRQGIDIITAPFTAMRLIEEYDGITGTQSFSYAENPLGPFPEKTDIGFLGKVSVGTGSISVEFNGRVLNTSERAGA